MGGWDLSPNILGSIGEGSGGSMTDLVNIQATAQQKELDRQSNEAKATVSSLINSYNSAKSVALQGEIVNTMKSYANVLPSHLRQQVEPYIRNGPTSEVSEKTRQFLLHNKAPKPPIYNEAPGAENANKYLQANHMFEVSDFKRKLNGFVYGASTTGDKQNFMGLDDGSAAIRGADGQVMIMSQQDLGLKELSEKTGIPVKDMLMNPNGVPVEGAKGFVTMNGRKIETQRTYKPFEPDPGKRYGQRITNVSDMPKSDWEIDHPPTLQKAMLAWKDPSTKDGTVERWKNQALKGPKEARAVAQEMSEVWSNYTFKLQNVEKTGVSRTWAMIPFVSVNEKTALIPIRGKPITLPDATGYEVIFYYDPNIDLVSNGLGEPLGSYEQAAQTFATKTVPRGGK